MTDNYTDLARCMGCEPHEVSGIIQQHAPWNGKPACDDALRERAAVVAWLRDWPIAEDGDFIEAVVHGLAAKIERGEHREK